MVFHIVIFAVCPLDQFLFQLDLLDFFVFQFDPHSADFFPFQ